ncbi:hypothetical protein GCM10023144_36260 [Pigmentiphaga soli]|uniref:RNA polymerase sigma factor 70 region 4 type 2 domain-containing protein n=1 Tax=Pigmentiphaga soli TaxID=1007095 RepID=A0ABP8HGG9_9BURK
MRNPAAYVYRVACNLAMDGLRGDRGYLQAGEAMLDSTPDLGPGPERIAQARSELACAIRAIEALPPRHQALLMALRVDGLTRAEAALRHGLSLRKVDTALRQALDRCAAYMEGQYRESAD